MAEMLGTSHNPYDKNLFVLSAKTAEELEEKIKSIPQHVSIKAMYGLNSRHYAWLIGDVRVVRKKKVKKTNNRSK